MKTIMNGFISLIVTITVSLYSLNAFSQAEGSVLTRLQGKRWVLLFDKSSNERVYSQKECFIYVDGKCVTTAEYYLSDTIETVFDKNNVGKIINGKYIIERMISSKPVINHPSDVKSFEIKELNANMLILINRKIEYDYSAKENFVLKYQDPDEKVYKAKKNIHGSAYSEKKSSILTRLQGKTWVMNETNRTLGMVFTGTKCFYYTDNKSDGTRDYYLSDTIETTFNKKKVGKIENGKYVIEGYISPKLASNQPPFIRVSEIKELNETTLILTFRHDGVMYTK